MFGEVASLSVSLFSGGKTDSASLFCARDIFVSCREVSTVDTRSLGPFLGRCISGHSTAQCLLSCSRLRRHPSRYFASVGRLTLAQFAHIVSVLAVRFPARRRRQKRLKTSGSLSPFLRDSWGEYYKRTRCTHRVIFSACSRPLTKKTLGETKTTPRRGN